jgi:transcription elongation factor Elf1
VDAEVPDDTWTPYAPIPAPDRIVCSFCGRRRDASLLLAANNDGSAAICEECVDRFTLFFEHRRARPGRSG